MARAAAQGTTVPLRPAAMSGDRGERPRAAHWEHERVDAGAAAARMAGAMDLKKSMTGLESWEVVV